MTDFFNNLHAFLLFENVYDTFDVNSLRSSDAYICVCNLTIIGSDNDLVPVRRQASIWTNAGILLIGPLGTNFSGILIEISTFHSRKYIENCRLDNVGWIFSAILSRSQCVYKLFQCPIFTICVVLLGYWYLIPCWIQPCHSRLMPHISEYGLYNWSITDTYSVPGW